MTISTKRQPKGQPDGGQFAASTNPESTLLLENTVVESEVTFQAKCRNCKGKRSDATQWESLDWKRRHEKFTRHTVDVSSIRSESRGEGADREQ